MFGCTWSGEGAAFDNVKNLYGQEATFLSGSDMAYTYGHYLPDQYVEDIEADGGRILFRSQDGLGRAVAYAGPNGTYRAIYASFFFGGIKEAPSSHSKADLMATYLSYLEGDSLVSGLVDTLHVDSGGEITFALEAGVAHGGRGYGLLGSLSGTDPGVTVGSVVLPLNYDPFMAWVVNLWNTPVFTDFLGTLDGQGQAAALLDTMGAVDPGLAGLTINFAYLLFSPIDFSSNAVGVTFVP